MDTDDHNSDSLVQQRKGRKAASQRRYYQRNKTQEQGKARTRAAIKRRAMIAGPPMIPLPAITFPPPSPLLSPTSVYPVSDMVSAIPGVIVSNWDNWSARSRIAKLRQWIEDVEWTYGKLHLWNMEFTDEYTKSLRPPATVSSSWLELNAAKARIGRSVLAYLVRVMDGEVSNDINEWRDLSLQVHQLASSLHQAVVGLEVSVRWVRLSHEI